MAKEINKSKLYDTDIEHVKDVPTRFMDFDQIANTGRGSFMIKLEKEKAMELMRDGWNVKEYVNPRYPDSDPEYSMTIYINFKESDGTERKGNRAPKVFQAVGRKREMLTPSQCTKLKEYRFSDAHLNINPNFSKKDPSKFTAYAAEVTFDIDPNPPASQNGFKNKFKDMYDD